MTINIWIFVFFSFDEISVLIKKSSLKIPQNLHLFYHFFHFSNHRNLFIFDNLNNICLGTENVCINKSKKNHNAKSEWFSVHCCTVLALFLFPLRVFHPSRPLVKKGEKERRDRKHSYWRMSRGSRTTKKESSNTKLFT